MATSKPTVIIFISSAREGRNADRALNFLKSQLESHFNIRVFDPKELNLPFIQMPLHWNPSKASQQVQDLNQEILNADAFVILTAEYNRGVPPALTNMLDHFSPGAFAYKAALIVSYSASPYGGNVAATLLLPNLTAFGLSLTPASLVIPEVVKSLSEDGQVQAGYEFLNRSSALSISQLVWLADALKAARQNKKPPKAQAYLQD